MPNIPHDMCTNIDIDRDELINLLLMSIALEEISLSHILNAEGELMQLYICELKCRKCIPFDEIYRLNRSVQETIRLVLEKEKTLKDKLIQVIQFSEDQICCKQQEPDCPCQNQNCNGPW